MPVFSVGRCLRKAGRSLYVCAGFGLDFVWPYLADYPEDQVAVIDDTCVMRPTHILGPSPLMKVRLPSNKCVTVISAAAGMTISGACGCMLCWSHVQVSRRPPLWCVVS